MARNQNRLSGRRQPQQQISNLPPTDGIDARHRLIEQQQPRIVYQRLSQFDALPHAVAATAELAVSPIAHADFGQHPLGAFLGFWATDKSGIAKNSREEKIRARDAKIKQDAENARMAKLYRKEVLGEQEQPGFISLGEIKAAPAPAAKVEETVSGD